MRRWLCFLLALALAGCDEDPKPPAPAAKAAAGAPVSGRCPVTVPGGLVATFAG